LGSIIIEQLTWGGQGPAARFKAIEGFMQVHVDRHSSAVGNPFAGGSSLHVCQAYDELLSVVLTTPIQVNASFYEFVDILRFSDTRLRAPSVDESLLLQRLAFKHGVNVHHRPSPVSPFAVRAWLVFHAALLVHGRSIALYCWCTRGCICCCGNGLPTIPRWTCHAQSLAGALIWLACRYRAQLQALQFPPSVWDHVAAHTFVDGGLGHDTEARYAAEDWSEALVAQWQREHPLALLQDSEGESWLITFLHYIRLGGSQQVWLTDAKGVWYDEREDRHGYAALPVYLTLRAVCHEWCFTVAHFNPRVPFFGHLEPFFIGRRAQYRSARRRQVHA